MHEQVSLTIEGKPGQEVQVWYRGSASDDTDDPAPIVYTGKLGADGRVTISVPRAYLVVGYPTRKGGTPLPLHDDNSTSRTVKLPADQ